MDDKIYTIPYFAFLVDREGIISTLIETPFQVPPTEWRSLKGKNIYDVFSVSVDEAKHAAADGKTIVRSSTSTGKTQAYFEHHLKSDYRLNGWTTCFSVNVSHYVDREKKYEEEIARLKESVRKLEKETLFKDKVLSVVAHDLTAPINNADALVNISELEIEKEDIPLLKASINAQMNQLRGLTEQLFGWASRAFKDPSNAERKRLYVNPIVKENINLLQCDAERKGITIMNNVPWQFFVLCNEDHLIMILRNLISNAIKFTHENGVVIVSGFVSAKGQEISVADNGVGMDNKKIEELLSSEVQDPQYGTKGERGLGIGLQLCKCYAEANNATFSISSKPEKGSVFRLVFPFE